MAPTLSVTRQRQVRRRLSAVEPSRLSKRLSAVRRRGFSRWAVLTSLCLLLAVAFLLAGNAPVTRSQSAAGESCRYFAQTEHYVCDAFLECFDARGGLEIFGYPLSEPFFDLAHDGLRVQYFQRARMEFHPGNPPLYQVQLGLLIDELGYSWPPVSIDDIPAPDDPNHRYFPETQHVVSHAFLDAFREKGGLDIFGYPRSDFLFEDGKVVQYFQRARMEWDRDNAKRPIQLTNVGELYIERLGIPPECRGPVPQEQVSGGLRGEAQHGAGDCASPTDLGKHRHRHAQRAGGCRWSGSRCRACRCPHSRRDHRCAGDSFKPPGQRAECQCFGALPHHRPDRNADRLHLRERRERAASRGCNILSPRSLPGG